MRYHLRRFLRASEEIAREGGAESQQYLLMLALKGMPPDMEPTVGAIAERLQIRQHSAAELIQRTEERGWVRRERGTQDRRVVHVSLTSMGDALLRRLAARHRVQLQAIGPALVAALSDVLVAADAPGGAR
jgi:DNA-binding MarR family transcriptional regulator